LHTLKAGDVKQTLMVHSTIVNAEQFLDHCDRGEKKKIKKKYRDLISQRIGWNQTGNLINAVKKLADFSARYQVSFFSNSGKDNNMNIFFLNAQKRQNF